MADPAAHHFDVTLSIQALTLAHSPLRLPCWIPGSYLLREFARHIVSLRSGRRRGHCRDQNRQTQLDARPRPGPPAGGALPGVRVFDLSVRGAYLDLERGFFNGSSVFLKSPAAPTNQSAWKLPHRNIRPAPTGSWSPACRAWARRPAWFWPLLRRQLCRADRPPGGNGPDRPGALHRRRRAARNCRRRPASR